jgi:hypothetical protein
MSRLSLVLTLSAIVVGIPLQSSSAEPLAILQVTDNEWEDSAPRLNEAGQLAWVGVREHGFGIFFYDGVEVIRLTDNSDRDRNVVINDLGQVAWSGERDNEEIFLWREGETSQITHDVGSSFVLDDKVTDINNAGDIVWQAFGEVRMFDGATVRVLADDNFSRSSIRLSEAGHVVWAGVTRSGGQAHSDQEVFVYDEHGLLQLTNNQLSDSYPQVNSAGDVVWVREIFSPWHYQIMHWNGSETVVVADNVFAPSSLRINESGKMAWSSGRHDAGIFIADETGVTQFTAHGPADKSPSLNDLGHLVWTHKAEDGYEIMYYDGVSVQQITESGSKAWAPSLNNAGHIAWQVVPSDRSEREVFIAVPARQMRWKLLAYVDRSIENGSLVGVGRGRSADRRLALIRRLLVKIDSGLGDKRRRTCIRLHSLDFMLKKFSTGSAVSFLHRMLDSLIDAYECRR